MSFIGLIIVGLGYSQT